MENSLNTTSVHNEQTEQSQENIHPQTNTPTEEPQLETTEEVSSQESKIEEPVANITENQVVENPTSNENQVISSDENLQTESNVDDDVEEDEDEDLEENTEIPDDMYDDFSKEEVVATLEEVVKEKDINKIKKQVSLLRLKYTNIVREEREQKLAEDLSSEEEKSDDAQQEIIANKALNERFQKAFTIYKENKQLHIEQLEQQKLQNLEEKKALLENLKELIDSNESLKSIYDSFKEIQEKWRDIGPVPQNDTSELWQNYHFYVEKFFDKVKINKELKELDLKKNLEQKIALCEKAEELLLNPSVYKAFSILQQYHAQWKEIGAVPEDKKEEIWLRFKDASDRINQKRKEHYENLLKEQESNYQAKLALCSKAQEVTNIDYSSIKQINAASKETSELLKTWKTIGAVPKQHNEEIWERFKGTLDVFYENKKQFFAKLKSEQLDNYNKKLNLCIQAEAIALRTDWRKATDDILKIQKEWKTIGIVNRKQSEILWKRFRKACDDFFTAKEEYFKNIESHEKENLALKEALIQKVKDTPVVDSKEENLEIIKNFQREWTAIGYTPIADKERLWKEFRAAIDQRFEKLNMKAEDIKKIQYQQHIKNILEDDNSSEALRRERRFLQNRITKLTEDVILWENNLGFFASSKNADLLKAEFETKITKAKEEVKQLESKLKLLKGIK
ncbi:MAG: DUF349 domain-containing protein [Bacteroidales bacterium]|nr:DUF349 domain-containing protein [Bacteroidales bacterium]